MFRSSLKRSKINEECLHVASARQSQARVSVREVPRTAVPCQPGSIVLPASLVQPCEMVEQQGFHQVLNPLSCASFEYPKPVQRQLAAAEESLRGRGVGTFEKVYWFFQDSEVSLWQEGQSVSVEYQFRGVVRTVAVGRLLDVALHFKKNSLLLLAVAVDNELFLYALNPASLKIDDLRLSYKMPDTPAIHKVLFIGSQTLLMASESSSIQIVSFQEKLSIARSQSNLFARMLPASSVLSSGSAREILQVVHTPTAVYLLVRKINHHNWLYVKATELLSRLLASHNPSQTSFYSEQRSVEVHRIHGTRILHSHSWTEQQVEAKVRKDFPLFDGEHIPQPFRIQSIFVDSRGLCAVVTKCGYILVLRNDASVQLQVEPVCVPKNLGEVGLFVAKRVESSSKQHRSNSVVCSLGAGNLTLLSDSLVYFDEKRIDVVKTEEVCGEIFQKECRQAGQKEWAVFSKKGYSLVNQLAYRQLLLVYLYYRCEVYTAQHDESVDEEILFNCGLENIEAMLGASTFCAMLIQVVLRRGEQFRVNADFYELFVKEEVRGHANRDFAGWLHELGRQQGENLLQVSERMLDYAWNILIEVQHKEGTVPGKYGADNHRWRCTAYWHALHHTFYLALAPTLKLEPRDCKGMLETIEQAVSTLDDIVRFVHEKKLREKSWKSIGFNQSKHPHYALPTQRNQHASPLLYSFAGTDELITTMDTEVAEQAEDSRSGSLGHSKTESSVRLESILLESIPKIKVLVKLYCRLMESGNCEPVPNLQTVLTNFQGQQTFKRLILHAIHDQNDDLFAEIADSLPELQLHKELSFRRWMQCRQKDQEVDAKSLAKIITSKDFAYLRATLEESLESLVEVLVQLETGVRCEMEGMVQKNTIYEKTLRNSDVFAQDQLDILDQRKAHLKQELALNEHHLTSTIAAVVRKFLTSDRHSYSLAEKCLDTVIATLVRHANPMTLQFLELELKQNHLIEKLTNLKKMSRRIEDKSLYTPLFSPRAAEEPSAKLKSSFEQLLKHPSQQSQ